MWHSTILHYIRLVHTTLHYSPLHSTPLHSTFHKAPPYIVALQSWNTTTNTTATASLHHSTSSTCGWGGHCNHCNHSKKQKPPIKLYSLVSIRSHHVRGIRAHSIFRLFSITRSIQTIRNARGVLGNCYKNTFIHYQEGPNTFSNCRNILALWVLIQRHYLEIYWNYVTGPPAGTWSLQGYCCP